MAKPPSGRIGVICAFNVSNAGMYSVDLAAHQVFADLGVDHDLIVTQARHAGEREHFGRMKFRVIRDPALLSDYDLIVYWGDFQNNPVFGRGDFARREVRLHGAEDLDAGYAYWRSIMLGDPSGHVPSLSVSNNMQGLPDDAGADPDLSRIYVDRFAAIYPRDPLGTQKVRSFSPAATCAQGIDAAFLLDHAKLGIDTRPERSDTFCTFFARSKIKEMDKLVRAIEERTGLTAVPIESWFKSGAGRADRVFRDMIQTMCQSRFVLSDTYHFCVNSLTLGVPVVAIGRATSDQVGTLGDHKKRTLFDMFGLGAHYLTTPYGAVRDSFAQQVHRLVDQVRHQDRDREPAVAAAITAYRDELRGKITDLLR